MAITKEQIEEFCDNLKSTLVELVENGNNNICMYEEIEGNPIYASNYGCIGYEYTGKHTIKITYYTEQETIEYK